MQRFLNFKAVIPFQYICTSQIVTRWLNADQEIKNNHSSHSFKLLQAQILHNTISDPLTRILIWFHLSLWNIYCLCSIYFIYCFGSICTYGTFIAVP